ncbi:2575_t:CDS:2 [Paraglomus occultum]|uniref:2575_t:CDS:1 n=1 Tax=Paraglomus occultum TaxID=144539 RepID=A0A9N9DH68_9GLOM|nr:2575_t:CDS:2 [Paraglomus occultum]
MANGRQPVTSDVNNNNNVSTSAECTKYIQQPTLTNNTAYVGWFKPPLHLQMVPVGNAKGLNQVAFIMTVTETTFDPRNADAFQLVVGLTDTETEMKSAKGIINANDIDSTLVKSVALESIYIFFYHQKNYIDYARNVREIIKPSLLTDLGFPPKLISLSYLTSRLSSSGPMFHNDTIMKPNVYGSLIIKSNSFLVKTETEQRSRTIFNALGLLGGALTGSLTVYAILFGSDTLKPWGCIQSYCCCFARKTRLLLRKSFPTMTLESSGTLSNLSSSNSSASSNNLLLQQSASSQHLDALKLFLKEYVVDSTYFENLNSDEELNIFGKLLGKLDWKNNNNNNTDKDDDAI